MAENTAQANAMHSGLKLKNVLKAMIAFWLFTWCLTGYAADPSLDLAQYRGKVVYLDFWASWCAPCRQSFPWMNAMQKKYGDAGLVIIAVNVDEQHDDALKFLDEVPANFKIIFDPKGTLAEQYKLIGMPSSFLIDPSGNIYRSHKGFRDNSRDEFEDEMRTLLDKQGTLKSAK